MKYFLILDSSSVLLSVGLISEKEILENVSYECWQAQSEKMIPEIDNMLKKHNVSPLEISGIYVAVGPGSYTGVRIAITIAKTFAASIKCDVYPFSSLLGLKDGMNKSICLINARSSRSYVAVYEGASPILKDCIMTNVEVMKYIEEHKEYSICGDTKYLGIDGKQTNLIEEIFSIRNEIKPIDNPLALSPVYMKD